MGFFSKLFKAEPSPPPEARKLSRNAKCWCGSGEKYKRCHHEADQRYFSREIAATCRTGG